LTKYLEEAVEAMNRDMRSRGMREPTIRAYKSDISLFLSWLHRERIQVLDGAILNEAASSYLNELRAKQAPATIRRKMSALRALATAAGESEMLARYRAPRIGPRPPHPLPEGMAGVRTMAEGATRRDHQVLVVLGGMMGLRVGESLSVRAGDVFTRGSDVWLLVRGKGDKTRSVPVPPEALDYLAPVWAEATLRGLAEGDDRLIVLRDERAARRAVTRLGQRVLGHAVATHDLRATFATAAYSACRDLRSVQELLGHASSTTTEGYTGVSFEAMKAAAAAAVAS
jgi:site-specific recombinase XerD